MSGAFAPLTVRPRRLDVVSAPRSALAVPDLDRPPPPPPPDAAEIAVTAARLAVLDAARAEGFAAGHDAATAAARTARATAETMALGAIATALADAAGASRQAIDAAALVLARLLLAALDAALPAAAARLAADTSLSLAAELAPLLDANHRVTLRVGTGLAETVLARLGDPRIDVVEDAALPRGDAQAHWNGGGAISALADRRAAVAATLTALGLNAEE